MYVNRTNGGYLDPVRSCLTGTFIFQVFKEFMIEKLLM